ncbi:hypothetical protein [Williamsia sp. 1138]|uniref:hypothetical protein n=1 Tax=Williamsia sp. 1138 TaxID=1903117 RepID=UPI00118145FE|nr:hypothetical protein [Williamsia sp. 1138]
MPQHLSRRRALGLGLGAIAAGGLVACGGGQRSPADTRWAPKFAAGRGLVTNEYALRRSETDGAVTSPDWTVTSGSLFHDGGCGWSGPIDGNSPDSGSSKATGSAVLRALSKRDDFARFSMSCELWADEPTETERTPEQDYDGVHLLFGYRSPDDLYAVTLVRRSGTIVWKRKAPRGTGRGVYRTIATAPLPAATRTWSHFTADVGIDNNSVSLAVRQDGELVLGAIDIGARQSPPQLRPGRVGWRGDNTEFWFRSLSVAPTETAAAKPSAE